MPTSSPELESPRRDASPQPNGFWNAKRYDKRPNLLSLASLVIFVVLATLLTTSVVTKPLELNQLTDHKKELERKLREQVELFQTREKMTKQAERKYAHYYRYTGCKAGWMLTQIPDRIHALNNHRFSLVAFTTPEDWKSEGVFDANQMSFRYSMDGALGTGSGGYFEVTVDGTEDPNHHRRFGQMSLYLPFSKEKRQRGKVEIEWFNKDGKLVIECRHFSILGLDSQQIVLDRPRTIFGNATSEGGFIAIQPFECQEQWGKTQEIFYRNDNKKDEKLKIRVRLKTEGYCELLHSPNIFYGWNQEDLEERYDFDKIFGNMIPLHPVERNRRNFF